MSEEQQKVEEKPQSDRIDVFADIQKMKQEDKGTPIENNLQASQAVVDQQVERARKDGWTPQDEWVAAGKDPNQWRDAREFNDRGELMSHIKRANDRVANLEGAVDKFRELNKNILARDKEELTKKIKAELAQKIEDGEGEAAVELTEKLAEVKAMPTEDDIPNSPPPADPAYTGFVTENSWYMPEGVQQQPHHDPHLTQLADQYGLSYMQEQAILTGVQPTPQDVVDHIQSKLQEKFPDRFNRQQTTQPARKSTMLETSGDTTVSVPKSTGSKVSMSDLDDKTRAIVREMSDGTKESEQEYIDMLVSTNALKQE